MQVLVIAVLLPIMKYSAGKNVLFIKRLHQHKVKINTQDITLVSNKMYNLNKVCCECNENL